MLSIPLISSVAWAFCGNGFVEAGEDCDISSSPPPQIRNVCMEVMIPALARASRCLVQALEAALGGTVQAGAETASSIWSTSSATAIPCATRAARFWGVGPAVIARSS